MSRREHQCHSEMFRSVLAAISAKYPHSKILKDSEDTAKKEEKEEFEKG